MFVEDVDLLAQAMDEEEESDDDVDHEYDEDYYRQMDWEN